MPQRFLKPGIRTSERFNGCSKQPKNSRDLYTMLLTLVDDFGRYEANPRLLKHEAFPLDDDIRTSQVTAWLDEIRASLLAYFYSLDGKAYFALANWTEVPRYRSKYPEPPKDARKLGCMLNDTPLKGERTGRSRATDGLKPDLSRQPVSNNQYPITDNQKPVSSPAAGLEPPKLVEPNAPPVLESKRQERPNSVELVVAQLEFVKINEREKSDPLFAPYTADEVRQAWQWFESGKDAETGEWLLMFGSQRKPVGCWKAAMMERIGHNRNNYAKRNTNNPGTGIARGEDTRDHASGF